MSYKQQHGMGTVRIGQGTERQEDSIQNKWIKIVNFVKTQDTVTQQTGM
jgi:hypothetical protein